VSLSIQMKEMERTLNGEDPNSCNSQSYFHSCVSIQWLSVKRKIM